MTAWVLDLRSKPLLPTFSTTPMILSSDDEELD